MVFFFCGALAVHLQSIMSSVVLTLPAGNTFVPGADIRGRIFPELCFSWSRDSVLRPTACGNSGEAGPQGFCGEDSDHRSLYKNRLWFSLVHATMSDGAFLSHHERWRSSVMLVQSNTDTLGADEVNDGKKHSNTWTNSGRQILVRRRTISTDSHLCFCFILAPGFLQPFSSPLSPILCLSLCFFLFIFLLNTLLPLEESIEGRLQGREMKTKRRTTSLALSLLAALLIHWPSSCSSSLHPYCTSSPGSDFSPPDLRLYLLHQGGVLGSKLTS